MTFVGIDHGTTAIRVAIMKEGDDPRIDTYEVLKASGKMDFMETLKTRVPLDEIELIAVAYSMGDAISAITPIEKLKDRGVRSLDDIGPFTGLGTKMFDEVRTSGIPAVALPGLHDGCSWLDERFTFLQSHIASPKKIAASFYCHEEISRRSVPRYMVVANISSNTVTILIKEGKVIGGIDAAFGAPGLRHGPLDVESLRNVDTGKMTANEAFSTAGVLSEPFETPEKLLSAYSNGERVASLRLDSLLMAVAMEISSLTTVARKVDIVAITGSLGEIREPVDIGSSIGALIERKVHVFPRFSAAIGAAMMAAHVKRGEKNIFGIPVEI